MLTRLELKLPQKTGDVAKDYDQLVKAWEDWFRRLNAPNALLISQAQIYVDQGLQFPATQVASSDPNNLDDYEEGSTSPTPTSGTGSFTTVSGALNYTKVGNRVLFDITVSITTNNTAATDVRVALPFSPATTTSLSGVVVENVKALTGYVDSTSGGRAVIFLYDGSYPGADSRTLKVSGHYKV